MRTTTLIVAGLHGSEPAHWQSWWQTQDSTAIRVQQDDWHNPQLDVWTERLKETILATDTDKVWLVAHSFGCLVSVRAALDMPERIAGLFLVAPADPERFAVNLTVLTEQLSVPSLLVASNTDPYLRFDKAKMWGRIWDSQLINLDDVGHINVASGFGAWPKGFKLFNYFKSQFSDAELNDYWRLSA
ncbi:MAG: alpha/beta hydrolase [Agitococcus sp.]|nr:alpha/beta hydrolase [Agitococcus sp.]